MTLSISNIRINALDVETLEAAYDAAAQTSRLRSKGNWLRLGAVQGSGKKPYVIAIRPVETARGYQFGCSCPHWRCRLNNDEGRLCKHQQAFLSKALANPGAVTFYTTGLVFVRAVAEALCLGEDEAIFDDDVCTAISEAA